MVSSPIHQRVKSSPVEPCPNGDSNHPGLGLFFARWRMIVGVARNFGAILILTLRLTEQLASQSKL
jgi:hypothetical protein